MGSNVIFGGFIMKPWDERTTSQGETASLVQSRVTDLPGIQTYTYQTPSLPGIPRGAPMSMVIQSVNDYEAIDDTVNKLIDKMTSSGLLYLLKAI